MLAMIMEDQPAMYERVSDALKKAKKAAKSQMNASMSIKVWIIVVPFG